jgi:hypothetical protein
MDKEQARFILRSFRPDGADAGSSDFAAALRLAMQDRDLCEWLAKERAEDAAFSTALHSIPMPDNLRNEILDALAWQRGDLPHIESPEDQHWARALAGIRPPADLRRNILSAMHATVEAEPNPVLAWKKYGIPAAAAAAITLAIALPSSLWESDATERLAAMDPDPSASHTPIPVELVRTGFLNIYQNQDFSLEQGRGSHEEIMSRLAERGLPCPSCIPPALRNIEGIGCREIIIDGRRGTVVCYQPGEDGMVHLVIFRAEDIQDPLPFRRDVRFAQHGDWATAAWRNHENVFVLLGNTEVNQIATLF